MATLASLIPTAILTLLLVTATLGAVTTADAAPRKKVVVVKRPAASRVVVVAKPKPAPVKVKRVWVPGHWKRVSPSRAIWIEGHWRIS